MEQVSTWCAAFARRGRPYGTDRLTRLLRLVRLVAVTGLLLLIGAGMAVPAAGAVGAGSPLAAQPAGALSMAAEMAAARIEGHREYVRLLAAAPAAPTKWGPLTAADKEIVLRVNQANMWEGPVSEVVTQHTGNERIRAVGAVLSADHHRLDSITHSVAAQLGITLPSEPTSLQKGWMAELAKLRGPKYDETYANRLRAAHGVVFGLIAEDRAATENSVVRAYAQTAVDIVMKHMSLLEGTGLFTPPRVLDLRPSPIRGPFSLPVILTGVAVVLVANLALAARRSWS
jgi:predicted outer membrane protein